MPSFITVSTASGLATPSITQKIASLIIGMRTRFETKPGASCTSIGVFPSAVAISSTRCVVSAEVSSPRITSTSGITRTGFMKCIPITWPGRFVPAARAVIEMDDVLLARMAWGGATRSTSRKIASFVSRCSVAASTTRSASPPTSTPAAGRMRASAASRAAAVSPPFFTCRAMLSRIDASPRSSAAGAESTRAVLHPAAAKT